MELLWDASRKQRRLERDRGAHVDGSVICGDVEKRRRRLPVQVKELRVGSLERSALTPDN